MEAMAYEDMAWDGGYGLGWRLWPGMEAMAWDGGYGLECLGMKMKQTNWR